jgi:WD40 repeat protein
MKLKIFLALTCLCFTISVRSQYRFNLNRTLSETNHQILSANYSSGGNYVVSAGSDNNIILWDSKSGKIYRTLAELGTTALIAIYSEETRILASAGDTTVITLWDPASGKVIARLKGHSGRVNALDFSPNGKFLASGSSDNSVRIWDLNTKKQICELKGHKDKVNTVKFSPDSQTLITGGSDKTLILWSVPDGKMLKSVSFESGKIMCTAISPDGNYIATGGDDKIIRICKSGDLSLISLLKGHESNVQTLDFGTAGNILLSGGRDQLIILWDFSKGEIISKSDNKETPILSVDISPDGTNFVSATQSSENIDLWTLSYNAETAYEKLAAEVNSAPGSPPPPPPPVYSEKSFEKKEDPEMKKGDSEKKKRVTEKKMMESQGKAESFGLLGEETFGVSKSTKMANVMDTRAEGEVMKDAFEGLTIPPSKTEPSVPVVEVFAPEILEGRVTYDKNNVYLIGRVSDKDGINTLLVNKNMTKFSEAGVFEIKMPLNKGENPVEITAINNKGLMKVVNLTIDCTTDDAAGQNNELPEIYRGKYYALIIGINDYKSEEIGDLDNPIKDAESLYNVLSTKYTFEKENIIFLKNPTQSDIINTMDELGKKFTENDNLLIFYAGHGYWDEKGKVGYWFPSDAGKSSTVNWFRNSTLRDFVGSFVTRHTLVIADACFSGAIFKTRAAFTEAPQGIENLYGLPSRKAMTSGINAVPDESVFIKFLVKRLEENQETFLTSEFLFSNFKTAVMNNSSIIPQYGVIQNVGDEGGDFIFIKR